MNARIATILSALIVTAIGAAIVGYRDVATLSQNVAVLQREVDRLTDRERTNYAIINRLDERVETLEGQKQP